MRVAKLHSCSSAPFPLPSHFPVAFYNLPNPLNPYRGPLPIIYSSSYGEGCSQKTYAGPPQLRGRAVLRPTTDPPFPCRDRQEEVALPLRDGTASGQLPVTCPHDRGLKTVKQTLLTQPPCVRGPALLPRTKAPDHRPLGGCLPAGGYRVQMVLKCLVPLLPSGRGDATSASPHPLVTSRCAPEGTLVPDTKKREVSEIWTCSSNSCGAYPRLLCFHSSHPLQNLFSHVKTTPTPLPQVPHSLP